MSEHSEYLNEQFLNLCRLSTSGVDLSLVYQTELFFWILKQNVRASRPVYFIVLLCLFLAIPLMTCCQRCNVTKYIYSSTVLKFNFDILVLYLSISILCYFTLLLHYIYLTLIVTSHFLHNDIDVLQH